MYARNEYMRRIHYNFCLSNDDLRFIVPSKEQVDVAIKGLAILFFYTI